MPLSPEAAITATTATTYRIINHDLKDEGGMAVAKFLELKPPLQILNLTNNALTHWSVREMMRAIAYNPRLETLM